MSARIVTFIGAKGGTGTTTACVEIARELRAESNVVLFDADLSARRSVAITANALRQLDAAHEASGPLASARVEGVTVAELSDSYESTFMVTPEKVEQFFLSIASAGTVIVDCPTPFSGLVRPLIARTSRFVVVTEPSLLGGAAARTMLAQLEKFGIPASRVSLLIDERTKGDGNSRVQVEQALKIPLLGTLPPLGERQFGRAISLITKQILSMGDEPELDALRPSDAGRIRDRRTAARGSADWTPFGDHETPTNGHDAGNIVSLATPREELKARIHDALAKNIDLLDASKVQGDAAKLSELRTRIAQIADDVINDNKAASSAEDVAALKQEIIDEALGLGPLEELMRDPGVTEIMVNGASDVYIEKGGLIYKTPKRFTSDRQLRVVIERIITPLGRRLDESVPMVDARLPDGSRVNAIIAPLALRGSTLTIRRFGTRRLTADDLLEKGSANQQIIDFLRACVEARLNIVISGGTGSGKTTFLNILSSFLPERERIVTIEDAAELALNQPHVVPLEARPANIEGHGEVRIRDLVRNALRMRPDRIVVGECRGAEALDMLQAMNTGHDGSLTTIHANSSRDALSRIETMVLMAGFDLPVRAIREQVASAINVVVQTSRMRDGGRKVTGVSEVVGMEGDIVTMQEILKFAQHGIDAENRVIGEFQYTGVQPKAINRFQEYGVKFDVRSLSTLASATSLW